MENSVEFASRAEACSSDNDGNSLLRTAQWYRRHGRPSRQDKAAQQQYLSPSEEQALAEFMLHMVHTQCLLPVKSLRILAQIIRRQRCCIFPDVGGRRVARSAAVLRAACV
ncbi:uncharacterized protein K489DRAFT_385030 [Dissoconium aciculare CBS 342.82]|uniref:Uncharacterized protein n=1 Tax=Dissoconium aciculare CBS 342.82 TaxID=1314786 RepID=A0A6J3LQY0_9PEZI|nr:uncharacterized protein K489DRAFT_385030 [Dissoconium aciculare CBS 342.82]KAF1818245.1 hypothetical protein K489DRAFT_385030 [Dissoconium aciculare CBS 342.82]